RRPWPSAHRRRAGDHAARHARCALCRRVAAAAARRRSHSRSHLQPLPWRAAMNAARDFVATLGAVVDIAVDVINKPRLPTRLPELTELALVVDAERTRMVEGGNPIRAEAGALLDVLAQIEAEREI